MALIWQDVQKIREAIYGIETREPLVDALTQFNDKLKTRLSRISLLLYEQHISRIEYIEHVVHDPPTLYTFVATGSDISTSIISGTIDDYKATDTKATDSVSIIKNDDYMLIVGSDWSQNAMDDPTHVEIEKVVYYNNDYCLKLERANGQ